jgi:UDP-3-O-[3-hydroxymyristoyl] N-acetylglucosamine deacetylase
MAQQTTIKNSVQIKGIGLHTGEPVTMRLEPLEADSGIIFYRNDKNKSIKLSVDNIVDTKMATTIGVDDVTISTIEHFLSAVYAYGIDNLRVIVDNKELPVIDGSSISFCMLLDEAGIKKLDEHKKIMKITKTVEVKDGNKYVRISPSDEYEIYYKIDFDHPVIGVQECTFNFSKKSYVKEIARARTFGFLHEVQYLRSIGLAKGGNLSNAIVLDDKKMLNEDGLRFDNEFVRHKILDAIGDLMLLGKPVLGKYDSFAGSHHLNHLLTLEIIKQNAYELVSQSQENINTQNNYAVSYNR